jgi:hypothetical protein
MTATTIHGARQDAERRQLAEQLEAVRARLIAEFSHGRTSDDTVNDMFERISNRFDNARVRTFVPILVERAVRAEFGREQAVTSAVTA